jgi:hypothetical protein
MHTNVYLFHKESYKNVTLFMHTNVYLFHKESYKNVTLFMHTNVYLFHKGSYKNGHEEYPSSRLDKPWHTIGTLINLTNLHVHELRKISVLQS